MTSACITPSAILTDTALASMDSRLDSAVHARALGNPIQGEAAVVEQSSPLRLGAFATSKHRHHEVDDLGGMRRVVLRHHQLE